MARGDIHTRRARRKDIESIFNLWLASMKYHDKLDPVMFGFDVQQADQGKKFLIGQLKKESAILLVAEKNDKIIGFLLGVIIDRLPIHKLKKTGHIFDIVVKERERNKGVGTLLLAKSFTFFKSNDIHTVTLSMSEKNKSAMKFYEKHKFVTYLRHMVRKNL